MRQLVEALEAGADLPLPVIDRKSKRVVDGFHRLKAYRKVFGDDYSIEVEARSYDSDAAIFLDCVELNAGHGKQLSPFDRARILNRAAEFNLSVEQLAGALHLTTERANDLLLRKTAGANGSRVTLKHTLHHLAGGRLSKKQRAGNERAGGMNQLFYINQGDQPVRERFAGHRGREGDVGHLAAQGRPSMTKIDVGSGTDRALITHTPGGSTAEQAPSPPREKRQPGVPGPRSSVGGTHGE